MSLESHIQDLLANTAAVSAILGAGNAARIYPGKLPQGCIYPALQIMRVSGQDQYHLRGPDGKAKARLQLTFYGETVTSLKDLATGLIPKTKAALAGYTGSRKGIRVCSTVHSNTQDMGFDEAVKAYRVAMDYLFIEMET